MATAPPRTVIASSPVSCDGNLCPESFVAKPGVTGRSKLVVKGFNRMPDIGNLPTGVASRLSRGGTAMSASVQVLSNDASCFTGTALTLPRSDGAVYKAKAP